jgi:PAS domain S-box-containing protein/diguanylate cyclase (GGDEF)-like protein
VRFPREEVVVIPYVVCQTCGFRAYSAAGHASVEDCPVCGTALPRRNPQSYPPSRGPIAGPMGAGDRDLGSLRAEIEERLGKVPPFFEPAFADARVRTELWRQTRVTWLDSPVPLGFRKKLLEALAVRSPWPWAAVAEMAQDLPVDEPERGDHGWPEPSSSAYDELVELTLCLLLDGPDEDVRTRLLALLGDQRYASLVGTLTYLETCRTFAQAHPAIAAAAGQRERRADDPHELALIEIDRSGSIISFTPVAETLFGQTYEAVARRPFTDLFGPEGRDALVRVIEEFGESPTDPVREQSFKLMGRRREGAGFEATVTVANRNRDGEAGAMTAIVEQPQPPPRSPGDGGHADADADAAARAHLAFEGAAIGMALLRVEEGGPGVITEANRAMSVITGREAADLVGRSIAELADPADADLDADLLKTLLAGGIPAYEVTKRFLKASGEAFWGELNLSLIRDSDNHTPVYLVAQLADITERRRVEDALRATSDRFAGIFDDAPIGMGLATLGKRWIQVNTALCATLGYSEAELLNKCVEDLIAPEEAETIQRYLRQLLEGEVLGYHVETRAVRADGQVVWVELSVSLVHNYDGAPSYVFVEVRDISERKRLEEELEQGTLLDATTGLPSRTLLFDRLEQACARLARHGSPFVVIFVRVDALDEVTANLGPERADAVLIEVGARLLAAVRSGDTVARYAADEFVIVCEDLEANDEVRAIAERILVLGMFTVGEQESAVEISVTVGLTVAADSEDAPAALVERADAAMHAARGQGAGYQEYCDSL